MEEKSKYSFSELNKVEINDGLIVNGIKIKGIQRLEIFADSSKVSLIKVEFSAKIMGLDCQKDSQ